MAAESVSANGSRLARAAGGILRLRGDLLSAGILASLRRWNAHGYRLGRELVKAGLPMLDSATLYRTLRDLERAGLVSSFWDTSASGPARRMYSITKAGEIVLSNWVDTLERFRKVFDDAAEDVKPSEDGAQAEVVEVRASTRPRKAAGAKRARSRRGTSKAAGGARRRAGQSAG